MKIKFNQKVKECNEKEQELSRLKNELEESRAETHSLKEFVYRLSEKANHDKETILQLTKRNDKLTEDKKELKSDLTKCNQVITGIRKDLAEAKDRSNKNDNHDTAGNNSQLKEQVNLFSKN